MLGPAHLLYLATAAGAKALGLGDTCGDLTPGKQADIVLVEGRRAARRSRRCSRRRRTGTPTLGALFTLAREECVAETRVAGETVYARTK